MDAIRETVLIFEKLKEEIITQFKEQNSEKANVLTNLRQQQSTCEQQMERVKANCNFSIDITMSINELEERHEKMGRDKSVPGTRRK